jgi:hypothetical protein
MGVAVDKYGSSSTDRIRGIEISIREYIPVGTATYHTSSGFE